MLTRLIDRFDTRKVGSWFSSSASPIVLVLVVVLVLDLFARGTSSEGQVKFCRAQKSRPAIDYGFFDHKTAYQRPRTRTTTRTRTIREAGGSKQESHPVKNHSYSVYQRSFPKAAELDLDLATELYHGIPG